MEVRVRTARLTDVERAVRLLGHGDDIGLAQPDPADVLRNLLFVPSATVLVAERERQMIGVGILAIRPSVRSGPFVGVIDAIGLADPATLEDAERRAVADEIVGELVASARNKGCTRVEVTEPLASAERSLWKRTGFTGHGKVLSRTF